MREYNTIGIDLAKNIMHLVETDKSGKKISQTKVKRDDLLPYLTTITTRCGLNQFFSNSTLTTQTKFQFY